MEKSLEDGAWKLLWAKSKPWHPLWKHSLDAAAVSVALSRPIDGLCAKACAFIVGVHDIGKADPGFQQAPRFRDEFPAIARGLEDHGFKLTIDSVAATAVERGRHERISASVVQALALQSDWDEYHADAVARAVTAHHGHWDTALAPRSEAYIRAQHALCEMVSQVLRVTTLPPDSARNLSAFGIRLAGHIVLCDWIASSEKFFDRPHLGQIDQPLEYFEAAKEVAREMVAVLNLTLDTSSGRPGALVDSPRAVQKAILDADLKPGLVIIEAPMGDGKTEASWMLAEQWRSFGYSGAYMALPTQATGEALFQRYNADYLQKLGRHTDVRLVHGMAWLRDDTELDGEFETSGEAGDEDYIRQWFRPTRRAMLAAHGTGTVDQFLLAGMNVRFGFLRLFGLDRRVLIVDEVHAYDAYMTAILCRGLKWCSAMHIPVVLLSATLAREQRRKLVAAFSDSALDAPTEAPYPLVTHVQFDGSTNFLAPLACATRELAIELLPDLIQDQSTVAELAQHLARMGRCVCVVLNTVRQAQAVYENLDLEKSEKGLFHARFTAGHREQIAKSVAEKFGKKRLGRPAIYVLVATQVAEQSLDVDFDEMISQIAPIDLLLQRSGRIQRHLSSPDGPRLHVLLPNLQDLVFGGTERVYDRYILLRTLAVLLRKRTFNLPADFRMLIESVYGIRSGPAKEIDPTVLEKARNKWLAGLDEMEAAAEPYLLQPPNTRFFRPVANDPVGDDSDDGNGWRAKTRLGADDRTCLFVPSNRIEQAKEGKFPLTVLRCLYRDTVKVPPYVDFSQPEAGYEASSVGNGGLRGLTLIPYSGKKAWKGGGFKLEYDAELGLRTVRL